MCQIQFIKRLDRDNLTKRDIEGFLNLMYNGDARNNDACGVYSDVGIVYKKVGAFNYSDAYDTLIEGKFKFLVGHNRYKTKGDAKKMDNNHPFETENFLVVHNGVITNDDEIKKMYNFQYEVETDSYIVSELLEYYNKVYPDNLKLILESTAEELYGSFSILVLHKPSGRLFYFKDYTTHFHFALLNINNWSTLIGTTDKGNVEKSFNKTVRGLFSIPTEFGLFEPDNETVYELSTSEITKIGEFKERTFYKPVVSTTYNKSKIKEPNTLKGVFRYISSDVITRLKTYDVNIINRQYKFNTEEIVFEAKKEITQNQAVYIEEEFVDYGLIEVENVFIDNTYMKTKIILMLERETISFIMESFQDNRPPINEGVITSTHITNNDGIKQLFGG